MLEIKQILSDIFNWLVVIAGILFIGFALVISGFIGAIMKLTLIIVFLIYLDKFI